MIEHRERIGVEMRVAVDLAIRHVRWRVAARRIGDAAMAARKVAHLRLPIGVVGREFVQKNNRRARACFFEIETAIVFREGVRHPVFSQRWLRLWNAVLRSTHTILTLINHLDHRPKSPRPRLVLATSGY